MPQHLLIRCNCCILTGGISGTPNITVGSFETGQFSGNVVGGTLTYDDVTFLDSVGVR